MAETRVEDKVNLAASAIVAGDLFYIVDTSAGSSGGKNVNVNAFVWTEVNSNLADNITLGFGTGNDLTIYHDGTDSWMSNATGDLGLDNNFHGGSIVMTTEDASGVDKSLLTLDPDSFDNGIVLMAGSAVAIGTVSGEHRIQATTTAGAGDFAIFSTGLGFDMIFRVAKVGSTLVDQLKLDPDAATSSFLGTVNIDQSDAAGAITVLELDQGDIDFAFIDFKGTSAPDGTRSISSSSGTTGSKNGAIRIKVNGTDGWVRLYNTAV